MAEYKGVKGWLLRKLVLPAVDEKEYQKQKERGSFLDFGNIGEVYAAEPENADFDTSGRQSKFKNIDDLKSVPGIGDETFKDNQRKMSTSRGKSVAPEGYKLGKSSGKSKSSSKKTTTKKKTTKKSKTKKSTSSSKDKDDSSKSKSKKSATKSSDKKSSKSSKTEKKSTKKKATKKTTKKAKKSSTSKKKKKPIKKDK